MTDEEFESAKELNAEFNAIVEQEFGTAPAKTSEDLLREIAALNAKEYNLKNSFDIERKKIQFIKEEEAKLREKLSKLAQERYGIERTVKDGEAAASEFRVEAERLRREMMRLAAHERANKEFADAAKAFFDSCMARPWFNSALDHQVYGAQCLAFVKRGFLGDYMGLGKTLTSLIWADMVKARRVLVLAPKETCYSFIKEIQKWARDRLILPFISKTKAERADLFRVVEFSQPEQFIIVANIETWRKDRSFLSDIIGMEPDCVIIDEAHTVKNKKTNAFKGISEIVYAHNQCYNCGGKSIKETSRYKDTDSYRYEDYWLCNSCGEGSFNEVDVCSVKYLLCMTGTPILNKPQELWPILYLIDRSMYPDENDFLYDFCTLNIRTGRWRFQHGGIQRLATKIGKAFIMRDYDSAGIVVPPQEVHEYTLDFNSETAPEQWKAYKILADHAMVMLSEDEGAFVKHKITLMLRFRQMVTWPEGIEWKDKQGNVLYHCPVTQSLKLEFAENKIRELLATGQRVILFSQFKKPLQELHRRLNGSDREDSESKIASVIYDGSTPEHIKERVKLDFNKAYRRENGITEYEWDVALCNYKVGGQSVTLTEALHTVILDEEWNPGRRDQAYGRTRRIGQDQETMVHVIRLRNDYVEIIDQFMSNLIEEKEETTTQLEKAAKESTTALIDLLKRTRNSN